MSQRIILTQWSGLDRDNAGTRLAKVFRMTPERAAEVIQQVSEGVPWEFEKNIADRQVEQAETYLRQLGFETEWVPVPVRRKEAPPAEPKETVVKAHEELWPPKEEAPRASWLDRFRKKKPATRQEPVAAEPAPPPREKAPRAKSSSSVRWVLIPVFLLLAVAAALPYWVGMQVELKFSELPAKVYQSGDTILINKNFERGWLRSSADNLLKVAVFKFNMHHEITHGPLLFEEIAKGNFADATAQVRVDSRITPEPGPGKSSPGAVPALEVQTTIRLDGSGESRFKMPAYANSAAQPATVSWQGLEGQVSFSADRADIRGSLTVRPFRQSRGKRTLALSPLRATATLQKNSGGVVRRSATLALDRVSLKDSGGSYFLEGMEFDFSGREAAGLADFTAKVKTRLAGFEKMRYGPGSATFKVRRLDAASIGKIRGQFSELSAMSRPGIAKQQDLMALLGAVLKKSPELEVAQLSLKTPEGEIVGHGKISVDAGSLDLPANPFSVFQSLNAEAALTAPVPALKNGFASFPLDRWEGIGLLEKKGGNYKMAVTFKNGKLAVNGRALGLSASKVKSRRSLRKK
ncbi:MAG: DUF945 family protein [Nitrospinales bacterium]